MLHFVTDLFGYAGFPPRWRAAGWQRAPAVGWAHVLADFALFAAFLVTACALAYVVLRRRDLPFQRVAWLFCLVFMTGGVVYLLDALAFWLPFYHVAAVIKLFTAVLAWFAVLALLPLLAYALVVASPAQLRQEIMQRTQELRDSEARLRAIFDTAGDCIMTLDDQLRVLTVNPACEQQFGLPTEQMIGRSFSEFMLSGPGVWGSDLGTGEGRIFGAGGDVIGQRADRTRFPASLSMSKINLGQGRIYTVIIHDLTKFKKTEEALRQSETRLRLVLAQVPAILCTTDRKLRVTLFTSTAATGLSSIGGQSRRFLGESLNDSEDESLRLLPAAAFQRALEGEAVSAEVQWQERVFQFHVQALRDARNQIQGAVGIGLDVTQRKRTEAALQFYAQELQQRNTELMRSNQELDEFAYVASHDLKEPLRGIHNYCSFLFEDYHDKFDDAGKEKLARLQYLTNHMARLIDSLLEFSRVGRVEMAVQDTDLNQVLGEVIDSLGIRLQEERVEIRVPERLPTVRCDQVRIAEVFRNLITNAMKYNDKEQKWIEIGVAPRRNLPPAARESLQGIGPDDPIFYVRDNGIGIPPKHWAAVFRIFKRLHGRDKFGGGTGAGLTIVKKIIERHGGQILLDSVPGEGTTFYFTIPQNAAVPAADEVVL